MSTAKLSERVQAFLQQDPTASATAKNRAQFLGVLEEVQEALEAGCAVKHIWLTLTQEGRITFAYEVFRRLVNKLPSQQQKQRKRTQ